MTFDNAAYFLETHSEGQEHAAEFLEAAKILRRGTVTAWVDGEMGLQPFEVDISDEDGEDRPGMVHLGEGEG